MELLILLILIIFIAIIGNIFLQRYLYLRVSVKETIDDKVVLKISLPVKNDKKALAAEQFFQSLHGIVKNEKIAKDHYSFEIFAASHGIYFIVVCQNRYKNFIENQIYAQYPQAQIIAVKDYAFVTPNSHFLTSELRLGEEYFLPIKTFVSFEVDPLASITGAVANLKPGYEAWIQIVTRPVNNKWQEKGKMFIESVKNKKIVNSDGTSTAVPIPQAIQENLAEIDKKSNKVGFQFTIRIIVKGTDLTTCKQYLEDIEASFKQFQTSKQNSIIKPKDKRTIIDKFLKELNFIIYGRRLGNRIDKLQKYILRFIDEKETGILNTEELASIYHLPNESVQTPNIAWAKSKKLEFPLNLPMQSSEGDIPKNVRLFGLTDYRNMHIPFGIKMEDRRRHMYLLGKTGTGKSTFLKNLIVGDIIDGKGLAVLDPHGDLVDELLDLIPEHRMKDVIYLDPSDIDHPIGLNMLDLNEDETMDLLADGIVSVFKKFFGDSWGPRLQYILTNAILTLLHCQNVSLLAVQRILSDKNYRKFLLKQVKDPFLVKFWEDEFTALGNNAKLLAEAIAPIQNKVGRFLGSTMVRNMVGQIKSNINLTEIMNTGKIFLVNLSQGKIGEENSSLLGGMIVTRLYTNAMQRAKIDAKNRNDFYLYVDEFQNFATESFIKILSEARKYGLNLIVTHQYIDQIDPTIQDSIFGNVGTLMNYVVGQKDALRLEKEYTPYLISEDLVNLDRFRIAMKMTIDGAQTPPFTAIAMSPKYKTYGLKDQVKNLSRQTYAKPREVVEAKLNKWASQQYDSKGNLVNTPTQEFNSKSKVSATDNNLELVGNNTQENSTRLQKQKK